MMANGRRVYRGKVSSQGLHASKLIAVCLAKTLSKRKSELFSGAMVTNLGAAASSTKREGAL